jgi:putative transposase
MEIRRRVGLPRMMLHVMNRGARKVSIFSGDRDRQLFVDLLGQFGKKYEVSILSWCLMPNHYHLETEGEGTPLACMMRDLDGTYARAFNQRHETKGCLFQGPFKSMAIRDDEGLAYVSRYIHLNPVDLGEHPANYPWSSCRSFLGLESMPSWMNPGPVYAAIRREGLSNPESYERFLEEAPPRRKKSKKPNDPVGDFLQEWIRHTEEKVVERLIGMEELLQKTPLTTLVAWTILQQGDAPVTAIAEYYGLDKVSSLRSAVSRFRRRIAQDENLRLLADRLISPMRYR